MVASLDGQLFIVQARSMDAYSIAEVRAAPGFVMRKPPVNAVSQAAYHHPGIVGKSVCCITNEPAAAILEDHRQVPVIECSKGTNTASQQGIDQAVVKIQAAFIDGACALGQDARPGAQHHLPYDDNCPPRSRPSGPGM